MTIFSRSTVFASLLLLPALPAAAQAVLTLTPSPGPAGTTQITLTLTDTGTTSLFGYDINLFVNSDQLSFVGAAPFTSTFAGAGQFSQAEMTNNTFQTYTPAPASYPAHAQVLRVTYDVGSGSFVGAPVAGQPLGYFFVQAQSGLSGAGARVTLSGPGFAQDGDSEVDDSGGRNALTAGAFTVVAAAPEPSVWAAWGIGLAGLGMLATEARKKTLKA